MWVAKSDVAGVSFNEAKAFPYDIIIQTLTLP